VGVKYTTARGVAEQVVDLAGRKLGRRAVPCRTGTTRLPGAAFDDLAAEIRRAQERTAAYWPEETAAALVLTHGTAWDQVAGLAETTPALAEPVVPHSRVPAAAIVHAVRAEMATTLADVVLRRTSLGSAGYPGEGTVAACGRVMARECGWDEARLAQEVADVKAFYAPVEVP